MSPNLGVGLFDRSSGRFSLARQTPAPKSPQDFGHTFVAANLANNSVFVKPADGSFGLLCCAFACHPDSILQLGGAVAVRPNLTVSSVPPDNGLFRHRRLSRIALAGAWLFEHAASMALGDPNSFLHPAHHCHTSRRLAGLIIFPQGCFQTGQLLPTPSKPTAQTRNANPQKPTGTPVSCSPRAGHGPGFRVGDHLWSVEELLLFPVGG